MCDLCSRKPTDLSLADLYPDLTSHKRYAMAKKIQEVNKNYDEGREMSYNVGYGVGYSNGHNEGFKEAINKMENYIKGLNV